MLNDVSNKGFQKHNQIVLFIFENVINQGKLQLAGSKSLNVHQS